MSMRTIFRDLLAHWPLADGMFRRLVWSRLHFPEVEMRFLNSLPNHSIDIAIDVGAAMGSYSWILNRKSRQVIAFEPGELHARNLGQTVFWTRISVINAAVGADCGKVAMYTPGADTNALHSATLSLDNPVTAEPGTRVREVEQVTLDDFLGRGIAPGRSVDILKVDVEGYELEVFKGASLLLERHHPLIFCEIEQRHNAGYAAVFSLLRAAGYDSYVFQEGGFKLFAGEAIESLQSAPALRARLDRSYDPARNLYVNNFVFQHPQSRIKVAK
jgi:FkbM family methyltransferase